MTTETKTILVADDDARIVKALTRRLEASHYHVLTAADGFEALKLVLEERPDLILLDVWMPVGIGFSVAERIREYRLNLPIIFLSASKAPGLSEAAHAVGAVAYLEKPYDPEALLELIATALQESPAAVAR